MIDSYQAWCLREQFEAHILLGKDDREDCDTDDGRDLIQRDGEGYQMTHVDAEWMGWKAALEFKLRTI
jgi:hypothetical protein